MNSTTHNSHRLDNDFEAFRILVIEDDPAIARSILTHLHYAGFDCRYSCDSSDVLDAVEDCAPHLVLLDAEQPDIDGYTLCAGIRRQSKVPIVLMCPPEHEERIFRGFQAGADTYIVKPLNPQLLIERVNAQLLRTYRYSANSLMSAA